MKIDRKPRGGHRTCARHRLSPASGALAIAKELLPRLERIETAKLVTNSGMSGAGGVADAACGDVAS
jgi:hypothetical protein